MRNTSVQNGSEATEFNPWSAPHHLDPVASLPFCSLIKFDYVQLGW
jgi:hypothetical protein